MSEKRDDQLNVNVNGDVKEMAKKKLGHGGLTDRVNEVLYQVAHGAEVSERRRLKDELESKRKDKRDIEQDIDDLRHKRDELEREISNIEERLDAIMDQEGQYEGFFQSIENDLQNGRSFWPQHPKIQEAAEMGNVQPEQIIEDLKERNPNIPEIQFEDEPTNPHQV
jgi:chromosome segregation ATPase